MGLQNNIISGGNHSVNYEKPNKYNFNVYFYISIGKLWLVGVHSDSCHPEQKKKILVLRDDPEGLKSIDPHFFSNSGHPVIARFECSKEGAMFAIMSCFAYDVASIDYGNRSETDSNSAALWRNRSHDEIYFRECTLGFQDLQKTIKQLIGE